MKRRPNRSKAQADEDARNRKLAEWSEWLKGVEIELDKPGRLEMWIRKWRGRK